MLVGFLDALSVDDAGADLGAVDPQVESVLYLPSALPTPTATGSPCPSHHPTWHDYWTRNRPAGSRDEDEAVEWCTRWQHWQAVLRDWQQGTHTGTRTSIPTRTRTKAAVPRNQGGDGGTQPRPRTPTRTPPPNRRSGGDGGAGSTGREGARAWNGGNDWRGILTDFSRGGGGGSVLGNRYAGK